MAHEYKREAEESHERKLKSYGKDDKALGSKVKATNFAGFPALNTDTQAGRAPLNSDKYIPPEVTPDRLAKKKGGSVMGAQSLKRLDKSPRKSKSLTASAARPPMKGTGTRDGQIPSGTSQQEDYDPQTKFKPGEMSESSPRKKGGRVQDYEDRSHESQGAQGLRPREGHKHGGSSWSHEGHMSKGEKYGAARASGEAKGELDSAMRALKYGDKAKAGKELGRAQGHTRKTEEYTGRASGGRTKHDDEAMDRALVKKMVKGEALTGKRAGGRTERADGGKVGKGKTTVNILIGGPKAVDDGRGGMMPPPMGMPMPVPAGAPPMAPPPMAAGPAPMPGGPPPAPVGGPPQMPPGGLPMPRARGGRTFTDIKVSKPKIKDGYPALTGGSGGGKGRREKILAYGDEQE
jgi:hypothetical protein